MSVTVNIETLLLLLVLCSAQSVSQSVFTITEKAPTSAFTFKTLLRHYAKRMFTPRSLHMKLGL